MGASCVVPPDGPWPLLLDFLAERLHKVARAEWHARMARGDVRDARLDPIGPQAPFRAHAKVWYWRELPAEPRIPFEVRVVHQDEHIVVADKPHFLPVTPKGRYLRETLLVRLKQSLGIDTLVPVHRLDRETAGLVLLSVRPETRGAYTALFRERAVRKVYEAVAHWPAGRFEPRDFPMVRESRLAESEHFMRMREVPGVPNAVTRIELVALRGNTAHLRLLPATGQRHQLRVHLAALGMPIVNDRIYPTLMPPLRDGEHDDYARPLGLVARELAFDDPWSGRGQRFVSACQLGVGEAGAWGESTHF